MTVTSTLILAVQTSVSKTAAEKTDSASDASAQTSQFGKLLTRKHQTTSADSSASQTDTSPQDAAPAEKTEETNELQREVAAALALLSGMAASVQIQTEEVQPQATQTDIGPTVSGIVPQPQATVQGDADAQFLRAAQQVESQPQAAQEFTARQTGSEQTAVPAVQVPAQQTTGQDPRQDTGTELAGNRQDDDLQIRYSDADRSQPLFRQVETVPVKVGDTPVADTRSPDMDGQIVEVIGKTLESGAQHVEIQLTPENLGTITIDLTRSQDGSLQVVLHTSTDKAADLLTQHSAALSTLLQSDSQSSVQVKVLQRQEETLYFQQQNQNESGSGQSGQQEHRQRRQSEDFLQQLRLGLIPSDEQAG